jgi:hypothetical protein
LPNNNENATRIFPPNISDLNTTKVTFSEKVEPELFEAGSYLQGD